MNVDVGIWSKLTRVVSILLLLAGVLGVAVWYLPVIRQNERMRQNILQLDTQLQKQEETSRKIKASFDALRYDPKAVERLAREKLGYVKPDETVVRWETATNGPLVR